jgi:hypothetical protein
MLSIEPVTKLSAQEKIRFFHLMATAICMNARGLTSDSKVSTDLRLLQSEAIVEMLHRLFEQSEHYYRLDEAQRPEAALFEVLEYWETTAQLDGIISGAFGYAFRKLPEAK